MPAPLLQVEQLYKSYGDTPVLHDINFDVVPSEIVCLLGPSGCGKSTLLKIISGLEQASSGSVRVEGRAISGVPVHRRGFGLMFQDLALFPHKDVRGNVAFGLRMAGLAPREIDARVREVLELVGLAGFERRDVNQLSGGEQQRVALARSLAPRPRLLMLDEPLSSLDRALRERLMNELRDILTRVGQTAIYVTHDQQEAFAVADRLVILNAGRVRQAGTPQAVYYHPADVFVARFLGLSNLVPGRVDRERDCVETPLGRLRLAGDAGIAGDAGAVTLLIRPEAAALAGARDGAGNGAGNEIEARLIESSFRGRYTRIVVQAHDPKGRDRIALAFELDSAVALPPDGSPLRLSLRPESLLCLPAAESAEF